MKPHELLLNEAHILDQEAASLKMPAGSTAHMCANVMRKAAGIVMQSEVGKRKSWSGNIVVSVAQIDGWVFVMPEKAGRPFSIAYATWLELPDVPISASRSGHKDQQPMVCDCLRTSSHTSSCYLCATD